MVLPPFDADALAARLNAAFREFFKSEAVGGIPLFAAALLALGLANSSLASLYFAALHHPLGPLSVLHWINDGLMALFFLMVGLEMKRELMEGQMSGWAARILPGGAALGGMIVPALIYLAFAGRSAPDGWAVPMATDIAFALGVLALVGTRLPPALRIFLTALAILDDLGAVVIIALFYSHGLSVPSLAGAVAVTLVLIGLNLRGVRALWPYLLLGVLLWGLVLSSGIHATLAGVVLALTIPLGTDDPHPPLHRLEHRLNFPVALGVVPLFGFANAGVSFAGVGGTLFATPVFWGVAVGLAAGKLAGVMGAVLLLVRSGLARLPEGVRWPHMFGVALLCGIGFTMSLFIGLLAFDDAALQDKVKIAILAASLFAGVSGFLVLSTIRRAPAADV